MSAKKCTEPVVSKGCPSCQYLGASSQEDGPFVKVLDLYWCTSPATHGRTDSTLPVLRISRSAGEDQVVDVSPSNLQALLGIYPQKPLGLLLRRAAGRGLLEPYGVDREGRLIKNKKATAGKKLPQGAVITNATNPTGDPAAVELIRRLRQQAIDGEVARRRAEAARGLDRARAIMEQATQNRG